MRSNRLENIPDQRHNAAYENGRSRPWRKNNCHFSVEPYVYLLVHKRALNRRRWSDFCCFSSSSSSQIPRCDQRQTDDAYMRAQTSGANWAELPVFAETGNTVSPPTSAAGPPPTVIFRNYDHAHNNIMIHMISVDVILFH